jgi:hypothetical protein
MKIELVVDANGTPLGIATDAANVPETVLGPVALDTIPFGLVRPGTPVIADRAYDSDPLREQLRRDGFTLIAPPTATTAPPHPPPTAARSAATNAAGSSNAPSPGFTAIAASSPATNDESTSTTASSPLHAPSSSWGNCFEIGSNNPPTTWHMRTPDEYNAIALRDSSKPHKTKAFPHEFDAIQTRRPRGLARCSGWFGLLR